jgi:hypothetical protein
MDIHPQNKDRLDYILKNYQKDTQQKYISWVLVENKYDNIECLVRQPYQRWLENKRGHTNFTLF